MSKVQVCSIPHCGKVACNSRGWCWAHYTRQRRYGDPLAGRTPEGEPLRWVREVALPYDSDDCLKWPFTGYPNGYGQISLPEKGCKVGAHRFICEMVHGAPPDGDYEAAHSCGHGHKGCVNPNHLSWKTPSENQADRLLHGTHQLGERCSLAKLTEADVKAIRAIAGTMSQTALGAMFGVTRQNIAAIISRKNWGWLV